jgi:formate dehydrogenase maturation protein FdhE
VSTIQEAKPSDIKPNLQNFFNRKTACLESKKISNKMEKCYVKTASGIFKSHYMSFQDDDALFYRKSNDHHRFMHSLRGTFLPE